MKRMLLALACAPLLLTAQGADVRSMTDALDWQTVYDATQPLTWRWDAADAVATVTVSGLTSKVSQAATVDRQSGSDYGVYTLDLAGVDTAQEQVFDVTVALGTASSVRETLTARLAYLPSVTCGKVTVRQAGVRKWSRIGSDPVAVGYSSLWTTNTTAETATLTVSGSVRAETVPLPTVGGFTVIQAEEYAKAGETFPVSVAFGDEAEASLQALLYLSGGFLLMLR